MGTLNNRCPIIIRTQKGTIILTTTHIHTHTHTQTHELAYVCMARGADRVQRRYMAASTHTPASCILICRHVNASPPCLLAYCLCKMHMLRRTWGIKVTRALAVGAYSERQPLKPVGEASPTRSGIATRNAPQPLNLRTETFRNPKIKPETLTHHKPINPKFPSPPKPTWRGRGLSK